MNSSIIKNIFYLFNGFKKLVHYYGLTASLNFSIFRYMGILRGKFLDVSKSRTIPIHDFLLTTMPNDYGISSELIMYSNHELTTTEIFFKELKNGMTCLDIGSNIGYFALLERQLVGNSGKVICIEPSSKIFEILEQNIKLQNVSNIEFFNFACGNDDAIKKFSTNISSNQSGIIDKSSLFFNSSSIEIDDIKVKKIDTFFEEQQFPKLDFVRFDTEGYELKIINGMTETIKKFHPILSFELHRSILGDKQTIVLLKTLEEFGYELKYCISGINCAKIGGIKSAKHFSISELIQKIKNDLVPGGFGVYFEYTN
jgi:FkbM family methyltransferase